MKKQFTKGEPIIFDKHMKGYPTSVLIVKLQNAKYHFEPMKLAKSLKIDNI